ncbi:exopolysaccharide biosynthesis polyprenyl glycosylphosphotransferase [Terriglobus roseus DSM 18391]|uniref:Exopolysaccharide biosynthesis polyprenyl glycosylphosphotransferase n=1 Tax=Terriglobus roseus (strain DSM 18391 / NRRL B-41598 / KBS 63) TaxID=926566 RepID=I3ZF03_TERRK|nr:sugar transferase [Terriglobus roseus]AFL87821.1 exopolysaccharide biosynthesis polyprenyl glycosylphosphotransferase [Terriglobus roseus DSM 18391]
MGSRRTSRPPLRTGSSASGVLERPSFVSAAWSVLDVITTLIACIIATRFRLDVADASGALTNEDLLAGLWSSFGAYMAWFAACLVFFTRSYGLYGPIQNRSGLNEQRMTLQATLVSGLILCGTIYLSRGEAVSRIVVILSVLLTGAMICARRALWRSMVYTRYREGLDTRNVLIIGSGRVAHALRNHLESLRHLGFRFRGFVSLTEQEAESGDADIVGDVKNCLALARALFIDEIFFSVPAEKKMVIALVNEARELGIDVRVVPDLYDGLAWNAPVEYIGQFPTIPLHRRDFPIGSFMVKRVMDITISSLALTVLSPLILGIAIAVRLNSNGPIVYKARRIGRKGRTFDCMKFRTMVQNADELKAQLEHMNERDGILFKVTNDPRITTVGSVLRKYSLDEIPQFFNVLRGDMSLVGPRPPIASEVERYDLAHLRRLDVLPGITGLWQVEARQDPSFDSYISLDTAYVENWNLWLDLKILIRTVSVVLGGTGT